MIRSVVSIFDKVAEEFGQPVFVPTLGIAIRSVSDEMKGSGKDSAMAQHPEDFDMYLIGTFDTEKGVLSGESFKLVHNLRELV